MAFPRGELKWAGSDWVLSGQMKRIRCLQSIHHPGGQGGIRHTQVEADGVLIQDIDALNVVDDAAPSDLGLGGFEPQKVLPHTMRIDLSAVVKEHASAQPEGPGL